MPATARNVIKPIEHPGLILAADLIEKKIAVSHAAETTKIDVNRVMQFIAQEAYPTEAESRKLGAITGRGAQFYLKKGLAHKDVNHP